VSSSEAQAKMDSSCGCQAMEVMGPAEGGREGGREGRDPMVSIALELHLSTLPAHLALPPSLPPSLLTLVPGKVRNGCRFLLRRRELPQVPHLERTVVRASDHQVGHIAEGGREGGRV
jgi:hypothetical protein